MDKYILVMNMGWDGKHVVKGLWDLIIGYWQGGRKAATYMGRGVFLKCCSMECLFFLNRMNSRQGIVKKEQDIIFKILIG